jgi:hypothetical protein
MVGPNMRQRLCTSTPLDLRSNWQTLGLEGTVDLRKEEEKFSFDKWEMALASKTRRYQLRQHVRVQYQPVEKPRGESAGFSVI